MKFEFSKEWCIRMAQLDTGESVGAGLLGVDPDAASVLETLPNASSENPNIVFGRFVNLMRRSRKLSREKLAEEVDIDISELIEIEESVGYSPEPRTVYQFASFFNLPKSRLMQLSGLTIQKDAYLMNAAVRFAASADTSIELSKDEKAALESFISALTKLESK
ncbi:MAG: hypothetical protein JWL63_1541 [Rhodocyclales bacterium]|nr:hypothetical protein [Rhodocyclales bacterium]